MADMPETRTLPAFMLRPSDMGYDLERDWFWPCTVAGRPPAGLAPTTREVAVALDASEALAYNEARRRETLAASDTKPSGWKGLR